MPYTLLLEEFGQTFLGDPQEHRGGRSGKVLLIARYPVPFASFRGACGKRKRESIGKEDKDKTGTGGILTLHVSSLRKGTLCIILILYTTI